MKNNSNAHLGFSLYFGIVLAFLLVLTGCGKKPIVNTIETTTVDSLKREISRLTEINKEISDNTAIKLPEVKTANPECDSLCNIEVSRVMGLLNREIVSGNNKFSMLWDEHQRLLKINSKVGETKSQVTNDTTEKTKVIIKTITKTVTKSFIPDFYRYSAYFGWLCALFIIYKLTTKIKSWLPKKPSLL